MQAEQGDRCSRAPEQAVLMMSASAAVPYLCDVCCCTRWLCVKLGLAVQQVGRMLGLAWGSSVYKERSHHLQRGQCRQHQAVIRPTAGHGKEQQALPALPATECVIPERSCHGNASLDVVQHMAYMMRCLCQLQSLCLQSVCLYMPIHMHLLRLHDVNLSACLSVAVQVRVHALMPCLPRLTACMCALASQVGLGAVSTVRWHHQYQFYTQQAPCSTLGRLHSAVFCKGWQQWLTWPDTWVQGVQ